ncbi:MAG: YIP1 family protein [Candidatus Eremiobacteraeota bacterium]|nr:YIP1 family protein [Candidatus Eremiobacteraeota bacterium]
MNDLEIPWLAGSIKRMLIEPDKLFEDVAHKEMNMIIPVVVLIIIGIFSGLTVYSTIPEVKKNFEFTEEVYNVEHSLRVLKMESFLYPVWTILFWIIFTLAFAIFITWLNGWGDFKGMFNCTSYLVYPNLVVSILVFLVQLLPPNLRVILIVLQLLAAAYNIYLLTKIAESAGKLPHMHAVLAGIVPAFFLSLLWFSYQPILALVMGRG